MVEVFKTNVQQDSEAKMLSEKLAEHLPNHKINFDLSDCDKILRLEGDAIVPQNVIDILYQNEFHCEVLE